MGQIASFARLGALHFAGSPDGGGVFRSMDNGRTWSPWNSGLDSWNVRDLFVAGWFVYAATDRGVFRSTINGSSWSPANTGLTDLDLQAILGRGMNIYVVTTDGAVFFSFDRGQHWRLYDISFSDLASQASASGGELSATELNSSEEIPRAFNLEQNYPNPFNPVTTIRFDIPEEGFVTLKVYDMLGKEVTVLLDRSMSPGKYSVRLDGSELASGTYLYRLSGRGFTQTRRFTLLK